MRLRCSPSLLVAALAALPLWVVAQTDEVHHHCGGEKMPFVEAPFKLRCATDFGITANQRHDVTGALNEALTQAAKDGTSLYLPTGDYLVSSGDLSLPPLGGLVGSGAGTYLRNPTTTTHRIVQASPQSTQNLLAGLVLDNLRVVLSSESPTLVRLNGCLRTVSNDPQIEILGPGAHTIEGNILTRGRAHPGDGIAVTWKEDTTASATAGVLTIQRNLIGGNYPRNGFAIDPERARQAMATLQGGTPQAQDRDVGHFITALQATRAAGLTIERNEIELSQPSGRGSIRDLATFRSTSHVALKDNYFAAPFTGDHTAVVRFLAPADAIIRRNTFKGAALHFYRDHDNPARPTKRTRISFNDFDSRAVFASPSVNGAGDDHTTASDLVFYFNDSKSSPYGCEYVFARPQVGTENFGSFFNTRDHNAQPARVCEH